MENRWETTSLKDPPPHSPSSTGKKNRGFEGFRFLVQGLGFRVWGLGSRMKDLRSLEV